MAEPGDRNPYAGRSLVLAKLWMRGYCRMLHVRIETGLVMRRYRGVHDWTALPPEWGPGGRELR